MDIAIDGEYIEIYSNRLRFNFYIDLISSLFALYVIIKHSTDDMKLYKIFLIDISVSSRNLEKSRPFQYITIFAKKQKLKLLNRKRL
jgi:hypothetical protein